MKPWPKFIPTFEPLTVEKYGKVLEHQTIEIGAPHVAIEPHGDNYVRISIGGITKTVDGISLCNAVNEALAATRRQRR